MVKETIYNIFNKFLEKYLESTLKEYLKIQNSSSVFDRENNSELQNNVIDYFTDFLKEMNLQNVNILKFDEKERTPALAVIVEPENFKKTNMIYGHFDKQLSKGKWSEGLGPYEPVVKENRIYGRGSSEGGFSFIATVLMLKSLQESNTNYNRTILFFETDKESGSHDLWYYYKKHEYILKPDVIYCMDGSVADYEHLYLNQSFKGLIKFNLKVQVGTNDVHSGMGGGLVPDSYRIGTDLLEQLQDTKTDKMIDGFSTKIPVNYEKQMKNFMDNKGQKLDYGIKFSDWYNPTELDPTQIFLNSIWKPDTLLTGFGNVPDMLGGNVLRGFTTFRTNLYLPPNMEIEQAQKTLKQTFANFKPLYNARVELDIVESRNGFYNGDMNSTMFDLIDESSKENFSNGVMTWATGESSAFLGKMQKYFMENIDFIVTGAKSFDSNSRTVDENLNLDYTKKMLNCVLRIMINYN